jgi:ATP-binding cassette subfamily F protein 3
MADETSHAEANKAKLMAVRRQQGEATGELKTLDARWLELQKPTEEIG